VILTCYIESDFEFESTLLVFVTFSDLRGHDSRDWHHVGETMKRGLSTGDIVRATQDIDNDIDDGGVYTTSTWSGQKK